MHLEDPGVVAGHEVEGDEGHGDDHLALGVLGEGDGATVAQHGHRGAGGDGRQAQRQPVILWPVQHDGVHVGLPGLGLLGGVPEGEKER